MGIGAKLKQVVTGPPVEDSVRERDERFWKDIREAQKPDRNPDQFRRKGPALDLDHLADLTDEASRFTQDRLGLTDPLPEIQLTETDTIVGEYDKFAVAIEKELIPLRRQTEATIKRGLAFAKEIRELGKQHSDGVKAEIAKAKAIGDNLQRLADNLKAEIAKGTDHATIPKDSSIAVVEPAAPKPSLRKAQQD